MDIKEILSKTDHTLLRPDAVWSEVKEVIDDAVRFKTASVCISPSFVEKAAEYACGRVPICTVIGFPSGCTTTAEKVFEASDAVKNGADEIDMVANIGDIKSGNYEKIKDEINAVKAACDGRLLKVIVETCLLSEEEKRNICETVCDSSADYIKTSTGFSRGGAVIDDIVLWKSISRGRIKIKAAGGIKTSAEAAKFIAAGADRIGASAVVREVKSSEAHLPEASES